MYGHKCLMKERHSLHVRTLKHILEKSFSGILILTANNDHSPAAVHSL